jgi:hypothetical protein
MSVTKENVHEKYEELMTLAGKKWGETIYFLLCQAVGAHVSNDWNFMDFYHKKFQEIDDKELLEKYHELDDYLDRAYSELTFFVAPDHHYYPRE